LLLLVSCDAVAVVFAAVVVMYGIERWPCLSQIKVSVFVADGINSVGDYNSPPGGCRVFVSVSVCVPTFFSCFTIG